MAARVRNRGERARPGKREGRERERGTAAGAFLSSPGDLGGGGNHRAASGDEGSSTEQLHCSTKKTKDKFANSPLGFGVFRKILKTAPFSTPFVVLQTFGSFKLFKEVENNQWPFLTSIERSTYLILSFECLKDISK
jgi:hypothetical protein